MMGIKIAIAQCNPRVGSVAYNIAMIKDYYDQAISAGVELIIFPEMCVTGYPLEDHIYDTRLVNNQNIVIDTILSITANKSCAILIGMPIWPNERVKPFNAALLYSNNKEIGRVYKKHLPNYGVFDEQRYFTSQELKNIHPLSFKGYKLGIAICEDVWMHDVVSHLAIGGSDVLIAINASPYENDKIDKRISIAQMHAKQHRLPFIYANICGGQDELVFDGGSFMMKADGTFAITPQRWQEGLFHERNHTPSNYYADTENDIYNALIIGLRDYLRKNFCSKVVIGLSGGIDSALVATLAADSIGAANVTTVMIKGRYTSDESQKYAAELANRLGVAHYVIDMDTIHTDSAKACATVCEISEISDENMQSRIRGMLLMAISNKTGALLLAAGNKSEYAVGYATLYGDTCGAFAPIKDLYKTTVYTISRWRNRYVPDISENKVRNPISDLILARPPTAELHLHQKDSDSLPDYYILDSILRYIIEGMYDIKHLHDMGINDITIEAVSRMVERAEFKRRQSPIGTKISTKSFGRDWRYPIAGRALDLPVYK